MSLLNEPMLDKLDKAADDSLSKVDEIARVDLWGKDGQRTPIGFTRLQAPHEKQLWLTHLQRQAQQEQQGFMPGDIASTATALPSVQGAITAPQPPPQSPEVPQ